MVLRVQEPPVRLKSMMDRIITYLHGVRLPRFFGASVSRAGDLHLVYVYKLIIHIYRNKCSRNSAYAIFLYACSGNLPYIIYRA